MILVQSLGELVDGGRDLETLLEDGLLSLDADITGPFDISAQIAFLGQNITTNLEVSGVLGEKVTVGVFPVFGDSLLGGSLGRGCYFLSRSFGLENRLENTGQKQPDNESSVHHVARSLIAHSTKQARTSKKKTRKRQGVP